MLKGTFMIYIYKSMFHIDNIFINILFTDIDLSNGPVWFGPIRIYIDYGPYRLVHLDPCLNKYHGPSSVFELIHFFLKHFYTYHKFFNKRFIIYYK